ncbi:hypothetical protein GCM10027597_12880 [Saccharopolyspora tripterygii]
MTKYRRHKKGINRTATLRRIRFCISAETTLALLTGRAYAPATHPVKTGPEDGTAGDLREMRHL